MHRVIWQALRYGAPTILSLAYSLSFAGATVSLGNNGCEEAHTSQVSRIKQRPPATDLSGPKASAESLTPRRNNLAAADAVDLQLDLFSFAAAFGSAFSFSTRSGMAEASTLSEGVIRRIQQLE